MNYIHERCCVCVDGVIEGVVHVSRNKGRSARATLHCIPHGLILSALETDLVSIPISEVLRQQIHIGTMCPENDAVNFENVKNAQQRERLLLRSTNL